MARPFAMTLDAKDSTFSPGPGRPAGALLGAAIAGLLGAAGCKDDAHAGQTATDAVVLSSKVDPDMTREAFDALCAEQDGTVEVHPHCGGVNTCRGFSYDSDTHVFTEHTCKAVNTCAGYSCVLPDDAG